MLQQDHQNDGQKRLRFPFSRNALLVLASIFGMLLALWQFRELGDSLGLAVIVIMQIGLAFITARHQEHRTINARRPRFQFTLLTLVVIITLIAVLLSVLADAGIVALGVVMLVIILPVFLAFLGCKHRHPVIIGIFGAALSWALVGVADTWVSQSGRPYLHELIFYTIVGLANGIICGVFVHSRWRKIVGLSTTHSEV